MRNIIAFPVFLIVILISDQVATEFENVRKLAYANNEFAFKLYRSLYSEQNTFVSPTSIFTALGMLYAGARTNTAKELRETLAYDLIGFNDREIRNAHQLLLNLIENAPDEYQLEIANAIVAQINYRILPEYKENLQQYYKAVVKEVDFVKDNLRAVQEINNWVDESTHGKITKLLDELDTATRMVLLNAVYFKGTWKKQFDPERTALKNFYNHGRNAVKTNMMHLKSEFLYGRFPEKGFDAIELPYKGEDISMVILLPTSKTGLPTLVRNLDNVQLYQYLAELRNTTVETTIPKFKLEYSTQLKRKLMDLGMRNSFTSAADLSGISGNRDLFVSDVIHKSYIEVNEEGSEAAAVTGIVVEVMSLELNKPEFTADHPFLFLIRDRRTDMILFIGHINQF